MTKANFILTRYVVSNELVNELKNYHVSYRNTSNSVYGPGTPIFIKAAVFSHFSQGFFWNSARRESQSTKCELAKKDDTVSFAFAVARISLAITVLPALRGASVISLRYNRANRWRNSVALVNSRKWDQQLRLQLRRRRRSWAEGKIRRGVSARSKETRGRAEIWAAWNFWRFMRTSQRYTVYGSVPRVAAGSHGGTTLNSETLDLRGAQSYRCSPYF